MRGCFASIGSRMARSPQYAAKGHRRTQVNEPSCAARCLLWRSYMEVRSPLRYLRATDLQSAMCRSLARPGALTAEGVYGYEGMWCQDEEAGSICTFACYSRCASLARDLDLLFCASPDPRFSGKVRIWKNVVAFLHSGVSRWRLSPGRMHVPTVERLQRRL